MINPRIAYRMNQMNQMNQEQQQQGGDWLSALGQIAGAAIAQSANKSSNPGVTGPSDTLKTQATQSALGNPANLATQAMGGYRPPQGGLLSGLLNNQNGFSYTPQYAQTQPTIQTQATAGLFRKNFF